MRTAARPPEGVPHSFSFVLASCNLSVVNVNNLLAFALAFGGESVSKSSLEFDLDRWKWPSRWLRPLGRYIGRMAIPALFGGLVKATGVKQPGPPFLRSPFLKLSAVFEAQIVEVLCTESRQMPGAGDVLTTGQASGVVAATPMRVRAVRVQLSTIGRPPRVGEKVRHREALKSIGVVFAPRADDPLTVYIESRSHRPLSLAKNDTLTNETGDVEWSVRSEPVALNYDDADVSRSGDLYREERKGGRMAPAEWICRVVLAQVTGDFRSDAVVCRQSTSMSDGTVRKLGTVLACSEARYWYDKPDFFLHVGDQIYYDFPRPDRRPDRDEYRRAYREAWEDDVAARYLLAQWPHYMTFDDHEFADQFARNFLPPNDASPDEYLLESTIAYRDYVDGRNPPRPGSAFEGEAPYWYEFSVGETRFFVLDTRTERWIKGPDVRGASRMIDDDQMNHLLAWMKRHPNDLKFVVTSVPFVAEVPDTGGPLPAEQSAPGEFVRRNKDNDKWSAFDFVEQREQIIRFVAEHGIERLVFLTGDMHCCYHAAMHVAKRGELKYSGVTIHELAGGPLNQLELGAIEQFTPHCVRRTGDIEYQIVLDRFHTEADAVLHVKVDFPERERIVGGRGRQPTPEVVWNVIRTITDAGTRSWQKTSSVSALDDRPHEPVMAGRICFVPRRCTKDLAPWIP